MTIKTTNDAETHFATEHLASNLKQLSVRGGAATFAGQGAKFVLNLGSTMILARLLMPQDFGLIAMVTAMTGFILVFKDMGLSMATVQRAEINHGQVSTLFWINIAISATLTLITLALAPAVAWFYKEPRLIAVTAALSSAFIFGGLTVQHEALLRRQMRLAAVATIEVSSITAGILTAIICAWAGLGYWALVWMNIARAVTNAAGVWLASAWRPGRPVRRSGVRSMLSFGGYLTGFSLVNFFARNLDNILIGRFCGAQSLGFYEKSYSMLLLPLGQITAPITGVAIPALSRLESQPERYRRFYLKAIKLVSYLSMPLVATMGALSTEIVGVILGRKWGDAAPIFLILSFAALLQPVSSTVGFIYVSLGQTRRMAAWGTVASIIVCVSFFLGLPWGAIGVASSYSICNYILFYPGFAFALKYSPITVKDVLFTIYPPFVVSVIVGLTITVLRVYFIDYGFYWVIALSICAGGIMFLFLARGLPSVWADINDIATIAKALKDAKWQNC
jgi:PST family polysaccharide transporter